jgi:acyl-CoA synthetase (AMP-forming)/AMP-acid ligase II
MRPKPRQFIANRQSDWRFIKFFAKAAYGIGYQLRPTVAISPGLVLERHAASQPSHPGLRFEDREYSYGELNEAVNKAAHAFTKLGVREGDVIALMMDSRPEFLFTVLGANKIGAVVSLINTYVTGEQLEHVLSVCGAKWVLAGGEHVSTVHSLGDALPVGEEQLIVWTELTAHQVPSKAIHFNPVFDEAQSQNPPSTATNMGEAPSVYIYTSGTTGFPKAAVYTNRRGLQSAWVFSRAAIGITPADVVYTSGLPLYHSSGLMLATYAALAGGATIALRRKFSVREHWADVAKFNVTIFSYVGELLRYLNNAPTHSDERRHRVRAILGAGLRPEFWDEFVTRFNIPHVFEIYGATESPIGIINLDSKPGMVGRMMPGQTLVRTLPDSVEPERDANGSVIPCKVGETGLLTGRITRVSTFDGYLDKSKNESKIIQNAFGKGKHAYNSGDLLKLNPRGYLSFEDRLGDTFRWKGENVATSEVGDLLARHPGVVEATVYGVRVPHNDGRAGMAALVVDDAFNLEAFGAYVADHFPRYSRPLFLRFEERLEITATYRHVKTKLKEQGFDPAQCGGAVLFLRDDRYAELEPEVLGKIHRGDIRL